MSNNGMTQVLNGGGGNVKVEINDGAQSLDPAKLQVQDNTQRNVEAKDLFTKFATVMAEGRGQGRDNVPAYNKHEAQGMGGIQDPGALGEQTYLPLPFDRSYAGTANLIGIINAVGQERFNMSNEIVEMADQQTPQIKAALEETSSVYDQPRTDFYSNRLNMELARKRIYSMYSFV